MVDSGLVSQLLNLVRKLHGGKSLCRLVRSLCLVIMTSFPYTSAECSLFQSKTIYFADSLKVTVNRPILSITDWFPAKWTDIHTYLDHFTISLNPKKVFEIIRIKSLYKFEPFFIYWLYLYNQRKNVNINLLFILTLI